MKKILFSIAFLVALITTGCYKTINTMHSGTSLVLSYPARVDYNTVSSGINYWNKALLSFPDMSKASQTYKLSLNLPKALSQDVQVSIGVDQAAFDSYNANPIFGSYSLMPDTYYKITTPSITIPAGKTDTTFSIDFYPVKMDIAKSGYLLPLSITSATGTTIHGELKTTFFHIEKDPFPPYPTSAWVVTGFSSQEASGEGPNNGRVIHAFDNNPNTFWHSQWQGGTPGPPHWFSIDMGTSQVVHGVYILPRQGAGSNGRPKNVAIQVSTDGSNWTTAQNITVADNSSLQKFTFSSPTSAVRYIKVTITTLWGDAANHVYTNMAEFKVF
ncbi:MAG TPA: discoidin domain-containing protein [Niabella sp.]|nr:discoidin domain-containing protein [Chitinophagaceae bacterium]HRO86081.1 discoidin domain-containing protein [Niabella sp.]